MPSLSLILPSYNKADQIAETIDSVLKQSSKDWELLVVDDGSTDTTTEILSRLAGVDKRLRIFLNNNNRGANACRNQALRESTGFYIMYLDADDLLSSDCVQKRLAFMKAHPELDFAVFAMEVFKNVTGDQTSRWIPSKENALKRFLAHDLPWQTMQPIWKKNFVVDLGGYDESFLRLQDVEFHTRALLRNPSYEVVKGYIDCYYRISETRLNFNMEGLLSRWISSALQYCRKFYLILDAKDRNLLLGTIHATYMQLLVQKRRKTIDQEVFSRLESELFQIKELFGWSAIKQLILRTTRFYNLYFPRVPGINRILRISFLS